MQAAQERFQVDAQRNTGKDKHKNFLVTYSLNKGLKKFKQKGFDAAKGEMKQLHDRSCWKPIDVSTMTPTEKAKALESLIFLVEKKDGRIKARHCANGSKQRNWIDPEDAASPTVMTDSILLTAGIEAKENRDVATWDIPNAFIQTAVEELDKDPSSRHGDPFDLSGLHRLRQERQQPRQLQPQRRLRHWPHLRATHRNHQTKPARL